MAQEFSPIDLSTLASSLKIITDDQQLFIDPANGSDDNDGSFNSPWASIYKAIAYLEDKHLLAEVIVTIKLRAGVHRWDFPVNFSHPQGNQIQIIGDEALSVDRSIGNKNPDSTQYTGGAGIYEYDDTSTYNDDGNLTTNDLTGPYDFNTTSCTQAGGFPCFSQIINPPEGADFNNEDGSRFAMWCRPFVASTFVPRQEDIQIRNGSLAEAGSSFGPNDYVVIHPWKRDSINYPFEVSGQMRLDLNNSNFMGDNHFSGNTVRPIAPEVGGDPEYPGDMAGRFDEDETTMKRMYALGVHRLLGVSAGPNGTDNTKDFILENLNTNRNQFEPFMDGNASGNSDRMNDLPDPSAGQGDMYKNLNPFLKFNYIVPRTYVYVTHLSDAIYMEGNRSLRLIENICFTTMDRLSSSVPNDGAAVHVSNGSSVNIGEAVYVSNFAQGFRASSNSSISYGWGLNGLAPVITKCVTGVLAESGSSMTLPACCVTGCEDAFVADGHATLHLQDSIAVASINNGFMATDNSHIKCMHSVACYNGQAAAGGAERDTTRGIFSGGSGFVSLNNSTVNARGTLSYRSSGPGYQASNNSTIDCSFSDSRDNLGGGVFALNNSNITSESVFVDQCGVLGLYAYNNSTIESDFSAVLFTGVDGPRTEEGDIFGDGSVISRNSSLGFDGVTAEYNVGNNIVVESNSSAFSGFRNSFRNTNIQDGTFSISCTDGGKVYTEGFDADDRDPDNNPAGAVYFESSYDGSIKFINPDTGLLIVWSANNDEESQVWSDEG
tara:strand:+ start:4399 stop:6723 length:2325 start_codon:yes stop_codon:yes gene_type:complete